MQTAGNKYKSRCLLQEICLVLREKAYLAGHDNVMSKWKAVYA